VRVKDEGSADSENKEEMGGGGEDRDITQLDPHQILTVKEVLDDPNMPKNGKLVAAMLGSMNVNRFERRVIQQLMEIMHRYICDVLEEANSYKEHAEKPFIDLDDIKLAAQARASFAFTQPPPRELMVEMAQKKNATNLPPVPPDGSVHLPPPEHCLQSKSSVSPEPQPDEQQA